MNGPRIIAASTLGLLVLFGAVVASYGSDEAGLRTLVRATARASFLFFLCAYSAGAARRLFPGTATRWMLRNRRYLGLSFAVAHLLHLDAIWMLSLLQGDAFVADPITVIFGGIAYLFVAAMALTSNDRAVAWLGPRRWGLLHWIWGIFTYDWVAHSLSNPGYLPLAALSFLALGLRIAARRVRSRVDSPVAASPA
jgi:DMSO/TMAO reductase YedYZ heme-binding membrane subunit